MARKPQRELKRGWTTGACATAAAKAAYTALITGKFPDPIEITLPNGENPAFSLVREGRKSDKAFAAIIKDAGDDPDVTHGAIIQVEVALNSSISGIKFRAGPGVGIVTREGLPLAVGEPAINPVPRQMIEAAIKEVASSLSGQNGLIITISVDGGAEIAEKTWNPRLGIIGGISILGTTGVVIPYSCSAWIESIHRGIDVARAAGEQVVAGCTGRTSENKTQTHLNLPNHAMIDMGDFVGGMLKYMRTHPVPKVVIGGGFAKITKLARGDLDLHSGRSQIDAAWLGDVVAELGASPKVGDQVRTSNTAAQILEICHENHIPIAQEIAQRAAVVALEILTDAEIDVGVLIFDRRGNLVGTHNG